MPVSQVPDKVAPHCLVTDSHGRKGDFAKNTVYFLLTAGMVLVLTKLSSLMITRLLGPENKGVYAVVVSSAGILVSIGNLGLGQAVAYFLASKRYPQSHLWSFLLILTLGLGLALMMLAMKGVSLFGKSLVGGPDNVPYLLLGMLFIPALLWRGYGRYYLLGAMRFAHVRWLDLTESLLMILLVLVLFFASTRLLVAVIFWGLTVSIQSVGLFLFSRTHFTLPRRNMGPLLLETISYGGRAYLNDLLQMVNYRLDIIVVSFFTGPLETGLYAAATSIAEIFWLFPRAIAKVLFPTVSAEGNERDKNATPQICRITLALVGALMLVAGPALTKLIPFLLGDQFRGAVLPALLLLPGVLTFSMVRILSSDLSGQGRPEFGTYAVGIGALMTLLLDLMLIPQFGVTGAAIASSVAYSLSAVVLAFFYVRMTGAQWSNLVFIHLSDLMAIQRVAIQLGWDHGFFKTLRTRLNRSRKG